jgi:hypothetical protein
LVNFRSRGDQVSSTQPRAPAERLAHGDEFSAPVVEGAEVACQRILQTYVGLALVAEAVEEHFMKYHRICCDELLALKAVDQEAGCACIVELGKLFADQVQPVGGEFVSF